MWDRTEATFLPQATYGLNESQRLAFQGVPFSAMSAP
jgi:hypothetical protein